MKYCVKCKKPVHTDKALCPNCGEKLLDWKNDDDDYDDADTGQIVAIMTAIGLF